MAKKATIVALRVLGCSGGATDDDLLVGMNWVKNNAVKPAVVNYSIGCRQRCTNQTIDNAAKSVIDSGVQWVQAAGNSNDNACYYSPQRLSEAITVGNSTRTDTHRCDRNYGSCLDIWAPGDNIVSA
ncbi:S8 family serine peptidase [Actinokineospora pegani]